MATTKVDDGQVLFRSSKTGDQDLGAYLEDAELGTKTLGEMIQSIFDENGDFLALSSVGEWATTTAYAKHQTARQDYNVYLSNEDHTSGVFATDLAAGKWTLIVELKPMVDLVQAVSGQVPSLGAGDVGKLLVVNATYDGYDLSASALGTAALEDVGTTANDVVQLDGSARLPVVDGRNLTNITIVVDTSSNFTTADATYPNGVLCFETNTKKFKIGDGATSWTSLDYIDQDSYYNTFLIGSALTPSSGTITADTSDYRAVHNLQPSSDDTIDLTNVDAAAVSIVPFRMKDGGGKTLTWEIDGVGATSVTYANSFTFTTTGTDECVAVIDENQNLTVVRVRENI